MVVYSFKPYIRKYNRKPKWRKFCSERKTRKGGDALRKLATDQDPEIQHQPSLVHVNFTNLI
ncbi:hypothetical protein M378DRAFT_169626 [Amanita muscaria Koide BX008]|uniref:Uncharacterized protein n=1 Tax=Amanita muscaria (strain Koide BX008) TaxID=946122 RepID=A0A0C2WSA5_AMAMK|nr:hypothetical protein M378DRAFT_169626 [Amanita muscaria Koide BX008]